MRKRRNVNAAIILALLSLLFRSYADAQTQNGDVLPLTLGENVVRNSHHLTGFFEKLYVLKGGAESTVNIIHIGDSHIQADFLTDVVRKSFQAEFGNAGRGLIVPARVAGTNEPFNFRSSSTGTWVSKRVIHPSKPLPIGVGGITISTYDADARLSVKMLDRDTDYSFNRITLFFDQNNASYTVSVLDSASNELGRFLPQEKSLDHARLAVPSPIDQVAFKMLKENDNQKSATIYGISLENGRKGILYHSIGVNGARYEHYNAASNFAKQAQALNPDLVIISLGTNESVEYPNIRQSFITEVERLVNALQKNNPELAFILVTPPDAFIRKTKPNPGVEIIRSEIIRFAVENGIAFWDMYKVGGGKNSAAEWKMRGLLRPDGIHFSRDGYAQQGKLLFEAIMKSYQNYVADRHP